MLEDGLQGYTFFIASVYLNKNLQWPSAPFGYFLPRVINCGRYLFAIDCFNHMNSRCIKNLRHSFSREPKCQFNFWTTVTHFVHIFMLQVTDEMPSNIFAFFQYHRICALLFQFVDIILTEVSLASLVCFENQFCWFGFANCH